MDTCCCSKVRPLYQQCMRYMLWVCQETAARVHVRGVCDGSCLDTRGEQSCRLVAEYARSSARITDGRGNAHAEDG